MRWLRWISGIVWIFSWRTIYLEVFRWHHMTRSLRFNPPPPIPGTNARPKAGTPLIAVCLSSVAAPLVFIAATVGQRARTGPGQTPRQISLRKKLTGRRHSLTVQIMPHQAGARQNRAARRRQRSHPRLDQLAERESPDAALGEERSFACPRPTGPCRSGGAHRCPCR